MVGLLDILGFGRGGMDENGTFRLQDPAMLGLLNQQEPQGAQMPFGILSGMSGNGPAMPLSQSFGLNGANMPSMQPQDLPAPGASPVSGPAMPPMPPQRPEGLGFNEPAQVRGFVPPMPPERPANLPAPSAAPAGPAPSAPASTPAKDEPGFLSKFGDAIGSIYGKGGPGDSLIALGAGLASGPNWGSGLMKGMAMVNANALTADKKALERAQAQQKLLGLKGSIDLLRKTYPGQTDEQYAAMAQNPSIVSEAAKRLGGADTFRPVTDPQERARLGIDANDRSPYQIDREGKLSAVGTPQNNVNVNTAANPVLTGLGDQVVKGRETASAAGNAIQSIHEQRNALNSEGGIYSGFGAERRLDLARAGALFGLTDPKKIENTQAFSSNAAETVLSSIKSLGANPSNADREYLEKVKGGNIALEETTIRKMLDIQERYARQAIEKHNALAGQMVKSVPGLESVSGALTIPMPPEYVPPQPRAPGAPSQQPANRPSWRFVQ